ncbi:MAG TPA: hypothetical protein PLP42_06720 [Acidobacteriota bacterium]|jgi:hypothetical protein|nr:hypothetical protein [Acidobacteriota bacterium]
MAGKPIEVAYYYRIKWGHHDEFIELFKKNHYPVLKAQIETGRILEIRTYTPKFHGDGRSDWNFLSVLVYRDWEALAASTDPEIVKRLYPDQETFKREEQRRFELVEAHWDVPLKEVPME